MNPRRTFYSTLITIAFLAAAYYGLIDFIEPVHSEPVVLAETDTRFGNALVMRVIDGDTIEVRNDGSEDLVTVRLLGVNTPETVDPRRPVECFGKEASAFAKQTVEGRRVMLESDPEADEVDKYGRLLREVRLSDERALNDLLLSEGYAYAYTSFPMSDDRKARYHALEQEAKEAEKGLWNPETCGGDQ